MIATLFPTTCFRLVSRTYELVARRITNSKLRDVFFHFQRSLFRNTARRGLTPPRSAPVYLT